MAWRAAIAAARAAGAVLHAGRLAARLVGGDQGGPRRILIAWRGHLGDFIVLTPMLAHLRRRFPEARITLGTQRRSMGPALFRCSPSVDDVTEIEFAQGRLGLSPRERLRALLGLLGKRFDLVVGSGSWHLMEEGQLAGAPSYFGIYDGHPLQGVQGRALRRDHARHEAENHLALAEALTGMVAEPDQRRPGLCFDETAVGDKRRSLMEALAIGETEPVLLVHPGSKLPSRRWPENRMAETVARLLHRLPDLIVVVTGTEGEKPLVEDVVARLPKGARARVRDAAGLTDIAGLAGLLDRASGVLSNDTGVMHFARVRGAPLVAVLGPENHRLWGPHPQGDAPAYAIRREVPCAPCRRPACEQHYCLKSVSVDEVEQAVVRMLERGRDPSAGALDVDLSRVSWNALKREGFDLPTVSVIVEDLRADVLSSVLPVIERQTYPEIEIVHLRRRGTPWADARDEERRRTLPIIAVEVDGPEGALAAATRAARGELLVRAVPGIDWRPSRLALDVAAATRAMAGTNFYDGRPVADEAAGPDALVKRSTGSATGGILPCGLSKDQHDAA